MRNKHNEGYTLPLVMVVLLVLAIVAVTIMTTSLKNMLRQQSFIEQMQAQYDAQGKIEMVVAKLQNLDGETTLAEICKDTEGNAIVNYKILEKKDEQDKDKNGQTVELTAKGVAVDKGPELVTIVCRVFLSATVTDKNGVLYLSNVKFDGYRSYEIGGATP